MQHSEIIDLFGVRLLARELGVWPNTVQRMKNRNRIDARWQPEILRVAKDMKKSLRKADFNGHAKPASNGTHP